MDQFEVMALIDLFAEPFDIDLDDVCSRVAFPEVFDQLFLRGDTAGYSKEIFEQREFAGRKRNPPACASHLASDEVHGEILQAPDAHSMRARAPRKGDDTRDKFTHRERL